MQICVKFPISFFCKEISGQDELDTFVLFPGRKKLEIPKCIPNSERKGRVFASKSRKRDASIVSKTILMQIQPRDRAKDRDFEGNWKFPRSVTATGAQSYEEWTRRTADNHKLGGTFHYSPKPAAKMNLRIFVPSSISDFEFFEKGSESEETESERENNGENGKPQFDLPRGICQESGQDIFDGVNFPLQQLQFHKNNQEATWFKKNAYFLGLKTEISLTEHAWNRKCLPITLRDPSFISPDRQHRLMMPLKSCDYFNAKGEESLFAH